MASPSVATATNDSVYSPPPTSAVCLNKQRYLVREKLSDTLYGGVWLCEDAHNGNDVVAIKQVVLHKAQHALCAVSRYIDNPWTERRIMTRLAQLGAHDNILHFHHEFVEQGAWYVVMDFCNGGDLLNVLQQAPDHRLAQNQAMALFAEIVQGVRFLHVNGIAHRDLSLENVLLQGNTPKLCDFGLSTETDTLSTDRVGKAYYMAPEIVADKEYNPIQADIWSLGILLFIMLTGSPLFEAASPEDPAVVAVQRVGVRGVLKHWKLANEISSATTDLLFKMLQFDPALRFQSVAEILEIMGDDNEGSTTA